MIFVSRTPRQFQPEDDDGVADWWKIRRKPGPSLQEEQTVTMADPKAGTPHAAAAPAVRARARPAPVRGITRTTLSEQTYETLKERILDKTLPAGAKLNIDALSRELNVSSSPIREALARLEGERLVVSEVYSGCSVAPEPTASYLHNLLDCRVVLEGHCASIGAPRKDAKVLEVLRGAYAEMAAIPRIGTKYREYRRFVQADARFHQAIIDSAANEVFSGLYDGLNAIIMQSRLYRDRHSGSSRAHEVLDEHRRILAAFEAGDGAQAAEMLREHLEGGRRRLLTAPAPETAD